MEHIAKKKLDSLIKEAKIRDCEDLNDFAVSALPLPRRPGHRAEGRMVSPADASVHVQTPCVSAHTCMHKHTRVQLHTPVYINPHTPAFRYTHAHTCTCEPMRRTPVHTQTCANMHTYTHTCVHVHITGTYACTGPQPPPCYGG